MRDIHLGIRDAVEPYFLDIAVLVADPGRLDLEGLAVRQVKFQVGEIRRAQYILVRARAHRVEAQRREDVPCAHLAAVVVAAQAPDVVAVLAVHHLPQPVLRLPGLRGPCVQVGDMVRRFVAMDVSADQALCRNVFIVCIIDANPSFPAKNFSSFIFKNAKANL